MNIALNALSARAGAGISVFQILMKALDQIDKKNKYYIFVSSEQKYIINFVPDSFVKIILQNCPSNPYLRVLYEQIVLPFYIYLNSIDILYSVGNVTSLFAPCKVVLFIENTNPFSKIIFKWSFKEKIRNKLLFCLGWFSSKKASKVRFCSERSKKIIKKIYNIPDKKCFLLRHGLDFEKFKVNNIKKYSFNYILTVAIVSPHKNIEVLIKAFAFIKSKELYDGKLIIVGNTNCYPDYYQYLLSIVKSIKIDKDVIFQGVVSYAEIFDFYSNADCFVIPSLEETFGLPLIESLYFNIPTIASDGMKYNDLFIPFNEIAKDYAIYFDPYSEHDLAYKIINAIRTKCSRDSRKFIQSHYNITVVAKKLVEEFEKLA